MTTTTASTTSSSVVKEFTTYFGSEVHGLFVTWTSDYNTSNSGTTDM